MRRTTEEESGLVHSTRLSLLLSLDLTNCARLQRWADFRSDTSSGTNHIREAASCRPVKGMSASLSLGTVAAVQNGRYEPPAPCFPPTDGCIETQLHLVQEWCLCRLSEHSLS